MQPIDNCRQQQKHAGQFNRQLKQSFQLGMTLISVMPQLSASQSLRGVVMNKNKIEQSTEALPPCPFKEHLFSFKDFDQYFDDFITRKWHRLLPWDMPSTYGNHPKINNINPANTLDIQNALPNVNKEYLEVSANNQPNTPHTTNKAEK